MVDFLLLAICYLFFYIAASRILSVRVFKNKSFFSFSFDYFAYLLKEPLFFFLWYSNLGFALLNPGIYTSIFFKFYKNIVCFFIFVPKSVKPTSYLPNF